MVETPVPAVGQVWQDTGPRTSGRQLLIQDITSTHAVMLVVAYDPETGAINPQAGSAATRGRPRNTRVRLDRLQQASGDYRCVTTVAGGVL